MTTPPPPFRADMVGSLLRPQAVHDARTAFAEGRLDAPGLAAIEDEAIVDVIRKQEEVGLKAVTDGEFRRGWWHFDFFGMLDGVDVVEGQSGMAFQGATAKALAVQVRDRVRFPADHPMLRHFAFVRDHTNVMPKMCIPSPTVM